jgi:hypothetical protein
MLFIGVILALILFSLLATSTTYLSIFGNCIGILFKDDVSLDTVRKAYKVHVQKVIVCTSDFQWCNYYVGVFHLFLEISQTYRLMLQKERGRQNNQLQVTLEERKISFWCFDPSLYVLH